MPSHKLSYEEKFYLTGTEQHCACFAYLNHTNYIAQEGGL